MKEIFKIYFECMFDCIESSYGIVFNNYFKKVMIVISMIFSLAAGIAIIYLFFWIIIKKKTALFVISCVIESFFIFVFGISMDISFIFLCISKKKNAEKNQNTELIQPILSEEDSVLSICKDKSDPINDSIDFDSLGMFDVDPNEKHPKCVLAYQIITSIIIIIFQIYNTVYLPAKNSVKAGYIAAFVVVKIAYMPIILQYNFIDSLTHCKKRFSAIWNDKEKIIFVLLMILYVLLFGFFVAVLILSKRTVFPNVNSARYFKNDKMWFKMNGTQKIAPQGFCNIQSQKNP